ncbi:UvrD-helicase domain-containing protein [Streptomyces sp. NPDC058045]|uniref:UvrD-helicase domain-containing protein n=1 Tax=Streptomyces sp. NPDC058045 TaxID=3346311 RepID=UPI0036EFFB73
MELRPTAEQERARDEFVGGNDLALVAGAGTGKTSTLAMMGSATGKQGMYIAFNKSIATEAQHRFGSNVRCRTSHSLAYQTVGAAFRDRLAASGHMPLKRTAALLGLTGDLAIGKRRLKATTQARLVMEMVQRFCFSTDEQVAARHLGRVNGLDDRGGQFLAETLLPRARWAWDDVCSPTGRLPFKHDHYLKMWALSRPSLPADFVLLDEAQDTNPVLEEVFLAQSAQRVCVGDPAQQIYEWRFAKDIMSGFPGRRLELTQSFRFGTAIAVEANRWLRAASSSMQLSGHRPIPSRIQAVPSPDAVLCRGNADALAEVLDQLSRGVPVALVGGGGPLLRIAQAAIDLQAGRRTSHQELFLFSSWGEVQEYAQQDSAAAELKAIVELVDAYGPQQIISVVNQLAAEAKAEVVVSTVHKAKGREWGRVRVGGGFEPAPDAPQDRGLHPSEARLIYVAVTRARHELDTSALRWARSRIGTGSRGGTVTPNGIPVASLPLTGQLAYPRSPMSIFLNRHLPTPDRAAEDLSREMQGLPPAVQPMDERRPDWPALGHTIDHRLRLTLGSGLGAPIEAGILLVGSTAPLQGAPPPDVRSALYLAGGHLLSRFEAHLMGVHTLSEEELTRLCHVAGYFEACYRSGVFARRRNLLAQAGADTVLEDLTASVPRYVVEDIEEQLQLAQGPFAAYRGLPADRRVCGPVFAGSGDLGGADADFILDGTLIDCKAVTRTSRIGRTEILQLAGYLLLDYDDQYAIRRTGLYLSRHGALFTWDVTDFLTALGAQTSLPALRTLLRDHLRGTK